jgi:hypothetical protein
LLEVFRAHDIGFFFYNGGGDSQDTTHKVSEISAEVGEPIVCVGIPKTVDNDLAITDCSPGFGSAAKYVATSLREAAFDLAAMSRRFNPTDILGTPIDMAFIDGMHLYEFVIRDISNVEKHCRRNSIIAVHDCIPTDVYVAERVDDYDRRKKVSTRPDWWTGDVWKIIPLLKSYRPDLCMYAVDSFPTGLLLLTNLDPTSAVLSDKYFDICREFQQLSLMEYGLERFISELGLVSTSEFENLQSFAKRFWL